MATDPVDLFRPLREAWWLLALLGLVNLAAGIVVIVWPGISLVTLAVLTGIFLLIDGVFAIVAAIAAKGEQGRGVLALLGALGVLGGLVLVKHPFSTLVAFVIVLGAWFVVGAVMRFVAAASERDGRAGNLAVGAIDLLAGVVILAWPELGLTTAAVLAGIAFVVRGGILAWAGWQARKLPTPAAPALPAQPA